MSRRDRVLMEGSHAIAEAAIQAGCRFYSGYPMTPSTEVLEYMAHRMPQVGGVCINVETEIEGINMVWGAAGVRRARDDRVDHQRHEPDAGEPRRDVERRVPGVVVNMGRGQGDYYQARAAAGTASTA